MVYDKNRFKEYILDFHKRNFESLRERGIELKDTKKIWTVIGSRRVGKTSILFNKILELKKGGVLNEQIVYFNFENPVFSQVDLLDIDEMIKFYWSMYPEIMDKKLYIFIDEPQVVDGWEKAIRAIYDDYDYRIFLTGSSSKLLSREIATSLRGRCLATSVYPLSFLEFLEFLEFKYDNLKLDSKKRILISKKFGEFLKYGSYPEVVLENEDLKLDNLKNYFDLIVYKDVIDRYNIKNTNLVKWLINYLVSCNTKEVNLSKVYLNLKSQGVSVSKNTLYDYFSFFVDSFFIIPLKKYDSSLKRQSVMLDKVYLNDVGFMSLFSLTDYGKRLENVVYLELLRKMNRDPLMGVNYWRSKGECDFVVSKGRKVVEAMQVCYELTDVNRDREVGGLVEACLKFGLKKGLILTNDDEGDFVKGGVRIVVKPVWKWALE